MTETKSGQTWTKGAIAIGSLACLMLLLPFSVEAAQAASRDSIGGLAVQPDGKIIAAGVAKSEAFGIARYESNGSLDPAFGEGGKVTENFGSRAEANAVALQPDGKIVVVGRYVNSATESAGFAIARFNANGSLDTSFSGDGLLTIPLGTASFYSAAGANAVALQSNGDIVVAGVGEGGTVVRLTNEGEMDTSFGNEGIADHVIDGFQGILGVAVESSGKVIVVGENSVYEEMEIVRLTTGGDPDTSFSGDGVARAGGHFSDGETVALQSDGKIVVVGSSGDAYTNDYTVFRYEGNGTLDAGFSSDGIATADIGGFDVANSVAIQSDGAILAGGENYGTFGVVRFLPNGTPDPSFGSGGVMTDHPETAGRAMALQADGKILVGGATNCCLESSDFLLSRYMTTGAKDSSFGVGGDVTTDFSGEGGGTGGGTGGGGTSGGGAPLAGNGAGTSLPNTVIGSHPPAKLTTKASKAKVKFKFSSSTPGATFKCKLDKEAFKPCQSPKSYKVKPGKHVFKVEAINSAGADQTPATYRFKVVRRS